MENFAGDRELWLTRPAGGWKKKLRETPGNISEWSKVGVGVRQGCLLSSVLFNLFLEFVMKGLRQLDSGVQMGDTCINNIRYVDDTTLLDLCFEKLPSGNRWTGQMTQRHHPQLHSHRKSTEICVPQEAMFHLWKNTVPSVEEYVKRRTRLAAWSFGHLKNTILSNRDISVVKIT